MKKCLLLLLCLLLLALPVSAEEFTDVFPDLSGEETAVPSGICGENLVWQIEDGVLTISGTGEMADCSQGAPWIYYKEEITGLVLRGEITTVGAGAFEDYDSLKEVDFGGSLREIGTGAFRSCDALTELQLPASFKIFGEDCFRECANLTKIHCAGGFPSFRLNCLWNSYVQILYPAENPWPVSLVEELETAFHGRIEFLASDGTDPYSPTEPEETEPETTVPETTEPPTQAAEAPTQAATEPVTEPTAAPTQATAEVPEVLPSQAPTPEPEEPAPEENTSFGKFVLALCAFTGVLSLVLILVLVLRRREYREDYDD